MEIFRLSPSQNPVVRQNNAHGRQQQIAEDIQKRLEVIRQSQQSAYRSQNAGNHRRQPAPVICQAQHQNRIDTARIGVGGIGGPGCRNQNDHAQNRQPYHNKDLRQVILLRDTGHNRPKNDHQNSRRRNAQNAGKNRIPPRALKTRDVRSRQASRRHEADSQHNSADDGHARFVRVVEQIPRAVLVDRQNRTRNGDDKKSGNRNSVQPVQRIYSVNRGNQHDESPYRHTGLRRKVRSCGRFDQTGECVSADAGLHREPADHRDENQRADDITCSLPAETRNRRDAGRTADITADDSHQAEQNRHNNITDHTGNNRIFKGHRLHKHTSQHQTGNADHNPGLNHGDVDPAFPLPHGDFGQSCGFHTASALFHFIHYKTSDLRYYKRRTALARYRIIPHRMMKFFV